MNTPCLRNDRARQILGLLKEHGPLPSSALQLLVKPHIQPRKLRLAIARLAKNKTIELRKTKFTGEVLRYYQIDQSLKSRIATAKLLGCTEHELEQPYFRYREYLHNDGVSLLATKLKSLCPDAEVIRDFKLREHNEALQILQYNASHEDLIPDLLLRIKSPNTNKDVWIAFELEKTRKDDRRLISKLRKYAAKSHVDGVVYYCDTKRIENAITTTFDKYVADWARRIWLYKENFVLLGDSALIANDSIENLSRLDNKSASLKTWILTLCNTTKNDRKDQNF